MTNEDVGKFIVVHEHVHIRNVYTIYNKFYKEDLYGMIGMIISIDNFEYTHKIHVTIDNVIFSIYSENVTICKNITDAKNKQKLMKII